LYGYAGKILRVNLTSRTHSIDKLSDDEAKKFIGGKGIAIRILFNELRPKIDALGPENKLVYAVGPFAATGIPLNSRWVVAGKSPETGTWADSYCGGTFAVQLRKAGYDALVIEGASEDPVYINIFDDDVEVRDASHAPHAAHLWGKMTLETELEIARDLGVANRREDNPAVVNIGPAGENLVKFAAVMHTAHRAAGRAGLGAVMGSKKLKAIAVRGTKSVSTANPARVREIMKDISTETVTNPGLINFTKHGQVGYVGSLNQLGMLPTKNFQQGTYEKYEAISGETMT